MRLVLAIALTFTVAMQGVSAKGKKDTIEVQSYSHGTINQPATSTNTSKGVTQSPKQNTGTSEARHK